MGYINSDVELDAILTLKGRELLTNDPEKFKITKFSLHDDEMDYRLWNTSHSLGTDYYGEVLENTPIIEPLPGEEQQAKFNLITLPKETIYMPQLVLGVESASIYSNQEYFIYPHSNPNTYNLTEGYTVTLWGFDLKTGVWPEELLEGRTMTNSTTFNLEGFAIFGSKPLEGPSTMTAIGHTFKLVGGEYDDSTDHSFRITVKGNETGARATMQITVKGKYVAPLRA